jgi:hypothetical protein
VVVDSAESGETTLVNAILDMLAPFAITIEDATELQCSGKNYLDRPAPQRAHSSSFRFGGDEMEKDKKEFGAPIDGAKDNSFWTPEREEVLQTGLRDEPNARTKAIERLRALHPKLKKPNTIQKRLHGAAPNGVAIWMTPAFWKKEIDLTLIEGIYGGKARRARAIDRIRAIWPDLGCEALLRRMEELASESQPSWFQKNFWDRLDPILLAGIKQGKTGERKAVDKVLRLHPELRIERVWARVRELQRQSRKESEHRAGRPSWTTDQQQRLLSLCQGIGLKEAASVLHEETGWPRDAIIRKAHKLGVPKKQYQKKQEWTEADRTFLLVSVRHVPVRKIARQLGRPEKAVWVQIWREGLPGAWEEGYSRRELCRKFHVSAATLRGWIREEFLKDGADGRVPERSVKAFLRYHRELVNWDRLDPESREWVLELSANEEDAEPDEVTEESAGNGVNRSSAKQLAATAQM